MAKNIESPVVETVETPVNETVTNISVESLVGKEYDDVVLALKKHPDFKDIRSMKINNVSFPQTTMDDQGRPDGSRVTLVVARNLETYIRPTDDATDTDEDGYAKRDTNNLFTSCIQIAAILKQNGEMQLANLILKSPKSLLTVLRGARVSAFSRFLAKGEIEQNPFAGKVSDYAVEHDTIRYYVYDLQLGEGAAELNREIVRLQAAAALGL